MARPDERAELEALQRRASLAGEEYREMLLSHPDAIDLPIGQIEAGQVQLFEEAGLVRGFMVTLPRPDGQAELDGLFVEPECWQQGIGRRLLDAAQTAAIELGAASLHVVASPAAQAFYEKCDFTVIGIETTRFGLAIGMSRLL